MKNTWLNLLALVLTLNIYSQYEVTPIPFKAYTANASILQTLDDFRSDPIDFGFNFNFYDNFYDTYRISTNGYMIFNAEGGFSPWNFNLAIPNASFPVKNAILGCYHDMDNGGNPINAGQITYSTLGAAPFRKHIVIFKNQPHFQCSNLKSTFQMIIYETFNIVDVQIINKPTCTSWNGGRAVVGLINETGLEGIAAPGRNTGSWTANQEGWRFYEPGFISGIYYYTACDDDLDGYFSFNLDLVRQELNPSNPGNVNIYPTVADAQASTNEIFGSSFINTSAFNQKIYASYSGQIKTVFLTALDCNIDYDLDTVPTAMEDLNGDGNLSNDDTDGDGIPNFLDNDDDGDMVLTEFEYVFSGGLLGGNTLQDTDGDGVPDYLDNDDDGDGTLTKLEDYNQNNNPMDDDVNQNGIPDYLDVTISLNTINHGLDKYIVVYPNPTTDFLNIENGTTFDIQEVSLQAINGQILKVYSHNPSQINLSDLQTGIYFLKLKVNNQTITKKVIKK